MASSIPEPGDGDWVHLDTREGGAQSLQKASIASFADVQNEYPSWNYAGDQNMYVSTDFLDGHPDASLHGTKAFGFHIEQWGGTSTCEGAPSSQIACRIQPNIPNDDAKDAGDGFIGGPGREVYLQFKRYFGRTAADTHAEALGPIDDFVVHHHGGGPGGRKWVVWFRQGGSARLDLLKQGIDGSGVVNADGHVVLGLRRDIDPDAQTVLAQGDEGTEVDPWWPDAYFPQRTGQPGGPYTFTLRLKLESSEGAGDGEMTWWVDGTKYAEATGLFPGDDALGNPEVGIVTWICPPQDQTEYFWDVVVWETPP